MVYYNKMIVVGTQLPVKRGVYFVEIIPIAAIEHKHGIGIVGIACVIEVKIIVESLNKVVVEVGMPQAAVFCPLVKIGQVGTVERSIIHSCLGCRVEGVVEHCQIVDIDVTAFWTNEIGVVNLLALDVNDHDAKPTREVSVFAQKKDVVNGFVAYQLFVFNVAEVGNAIGIYQINIGVGISDEEGFF